MATRAAAEGRSVANGPRQQAGLQGTTPSFPRSKTALVGFRPKVWETGHGHLVFGLHSLLAFCSVTTIQRYSMSCSRMERNERGLPGCRAEEKRAATLNAWSPSAEIGRLTRLYHAKREHGGAAGFAYGETDQRDPQFYVLSSTDAEPCTASVSRLIRDSRRWSMIEDGQGNIQVEGGCLRTLVGRLCGYWSLMRHTLTAALAFIGQQCASDGPFSENLAAILNCLSAIG